MCRAVSVQKGTWIDNGQLDVHGAEPEEGLFEPSGG
jgi:hypothetical protein